MRSDDAGKSWQPFTTGIAATRIENLVQVNNVLYAETYKGIATSTDGGERWAYIQSALPFPLASAAVVGDSLYFRARRADKGDTTNGLFRLQPRTNTLQPIEGMPVYVDMKNHDKEVERLPNAEAARISVKTEARVIPRTGEFAISGDTFYIEYERKLYRWTRGEHKWYDTGMQDVPAFVDYYPRNGFQFAVSGKIIYLGKSDGRLFQSLDGGDTWRDITATFPFPFDKPKLPLFTLSDVREETRKLPHFKDIVYVGCRVYITTTDGAAMSTDGENWHVLTDVEKTPIAMHHLAVDGTTLYGISQTGVYRLNNRTGIWDRITSEVLGRVTSVVVTENILYVGTEHHGVLRLPLHNL